MISPVQTPEVPVSRRPRLDEVAVRLPLLADLAAIVGTKLRPGSHLRQRTVGLALRVAWNGINRGDFEPALLFYERDAEVLLFDAEGLGLADHYAGESGWTAFIGDIFENFGDPRFATRRIWDGGDRLVAEIALRARGRVSGVPVARSVSTIYFLSPRGKVARQHVYWDRESWMLALEAAGAPT